jgi:hypothetical protein
MQPPITLDIVAAGALAANMICALLEAERGQLRPNTTTAATSSGSGESEEHGRQEGHHGNNAESESTRSPPGATSVCLHPTTVPVSVPERVRVAVGWTGKGGSRDSLVGLPG